MTPRFTSFLFSRHVGGGGIEILFDGGKMRPAVEVEKKIAEQKNRVTRPDSMERGGGKNAPVRRDLGGVVESRLARVEQYVQTVERQRDVMPRRVQELLDLILFGGDFSRGLDGHDHRTVHHHVHIGRETERRVNNRIETTRGGGK